MQHRAACLQQLNFLYTQLSKQFGFVTPHVRTLGSIALFGATALRVGMSVTSSISVVAERPRDVSCLSLVSFNSSLQYLERSLLLPHDA